MAKTGADAGALRRRPRTVFSADQLDAMEAAFVKQQYIVGGERTQLAHKLKLSETQVRTLEDFHSSLCETIGTIYRSDTLKD